MKPIGVQLYSVRNELAENYAGTIKKIAEMGYDLVEPAGFPGGIAPEEAAKIIRGNGLDMCSMHCGFTDPAQMDEVLETAKIMGVKYLIGGNPPNMPDRFSTLDSIKKIAEIYNDAAEKVKPYGLQVGYHNHDWEMVLVDGVPAYRLFMENIDPSVLMQIDVFWVKTGGLDPVSVVAEAGDRGKVIHLKDGECKREIPMTAVGKGIVDIPGVIKAAKSAEAFVVELDRCATDMIEALKDSIDYLKSLD